MEEQPPQKHGTDDRPQTNIPMEEQAQYKQPLPIALQTTSHWPNNSQIQHLQLPF